MRLEDGSQSSREADPADGTRQQGGRPDTAAAAPHHTRPGRQGPAQAATQLLRLVQHDPRQESPRGDLQERGAAGVVFFYRATYVHSAVLAVARRLSTRRWCCIETAEQIDGSCWVSFSPGRNIAISMYVCFFVCLSVCPLAYLEKPHIQISRNFLYYIMWPWLGSLCNRSAMCYGLPVLWITSCFHIIERMDDNQ